MNRARAIPKAAPIGWVSLDVGYTIRWRRGEPVAYVLDGRQMVNQGTADVLGTIPVPTSGWTDLAEVRLTGQRWLRKHHHQPMAGVQ